MSDRDTLLSSIVEHVQPSDGSGFRTTTMSLSGDPEAAAIVQAVTDAYPRVTGRRAPSRDDVAARIGQRVTLLHQSDGAFGSCSIHAREGTVFVPPRDPSRLALLPKGKRTNGYGIRMETLLDLDDGYARDAVAARVQSVRDAFPPELRRLTKADLLALPPYDSENPPQWSPLVLLGTWPMPDGKVPGALWLLDSYMPDDDIAEGWLIVPPGPNATSEHGSVYGKQLLALDALGVVSSLAAPIHGSTAAAWCDDYALALRVIREAATLAPAGV